MRTSEPSEATRLHKATSYVLLLTYRADWQAIEAVLPAHRKFLDEHFATGEFLASGPREPRIGGVILARMQQAERVWEVIAADPFSRQGLATYEVIAFQATRGPFSLVLGDPTNSA